MSRSWKIVLTVFIALGVVGLGYFFSQPGSIEFGSSDRAKGRLETPEDFSDSWDFNPLSESETSKKPDEEPGETKEISDKTFALTGRVVFPENESPESVQVNLQIRPINLPLQKLQTLINTLPPPDKKLSRRQLFKPIVKVAGKDILGKENNNRTVTTDSSGKFSIEDAPPGLYDASIASSRWSGSLRNPSVQLPGRSPKIRIEATRKAGITGKVVTEDGRPVEGAIVKAGYKQGTDTTGESGKYELTGLATGGPVQVEVEKRGLIPIKKTLKPLNPGEKRKQDFTLRSGVSLTVSVKDSNGNPVSLGRVGIARADTATRRSDGFVGMNPEHKVGHGPSRAYPLDEEGSVTIEGLHPGKVAVKYLSVPSPEDEVESVPPLMGKQRTVKLQQGTQNETTLTVYKGKKFWIKMVDAKTGEQLTEHDVDYLRAYDADGNRIKQAIGPYDDSEYKYSGRIDPRTEKIEVRIKPRGEIFPSDPQKYKPTTKVFTKEDLPELVVEMQPRSGHRVASDKTGGIQVHLTEPVDSESDQWPNETKGQLYLLDGASGRVLAARGGSNPFRQPLRVPEGKHYVYGTLDYDDERYAFFDRVQVLKKEISTSGVRAERAATLNGEFQVNSGNQPTRKQVMLTFEEFADDSELAVVPPEPLTLKTSGSEPFSFKYVPPGTSLRLEVGAPDSGKRIRTLPGLARDLPTFGSGESRSVVIEQ